MTYFSHIPPIDPGPPHRPTDRRTRAERRRDLWRRQSWIIALVVATIVAWSAVLILGLAIGQLLERLSA